MVAIGRKTYERTGVETIVHDDGILLLNEKHKEEGLDHKTLRNVTTKYNSNHKKHRYELVDEPKRQFNRIFIDKKLAIKLIMDCRIWGHFFVFFKIIVLLSLRSIGHLKKKKF